MMKKQQTFSITLDMEKLALATYQGKGDARIKEITDNYAHMIRRRIFEYVAERTGFYRKESKKGNHGQA